MANAPKRRWFRFSLRSMFAVFTVVAVWLGWNVHLVRERMAARASLIGIDHAGPRPNVEAWLSITGPFKGAIKPTAPYRVSKVREWLGDEPVWWIAYEPGMDP